MQVLGRTVELIKMSDIGNGWLEVAMAVDGRKYSWVEHKSHIQDLPPGSDVVEYLGDQAVGLADSGVRPN